MLVVKIQFLYVIHQVDYYIGQKDTNSDCPEHNGTDINRPVSVQVGILIAFQKLQRWYVGGVNMTQFSCYLYIQG